MAYVPLYGRITDDMGGCAHSLCLRGKVTSIGFWLNSWFGEVMRVDARLINGREIVKKPDLRRVKKSDRADVLKRCKEDVDAYNKVVIDLDLPANKQFIFRINEIEISYDRLKLLNDIRLKKMDRMIEHLQNTDEKILELARVMRE